jgi:uncharacterized membrane protein
MKPITTTLIGGVVFLVPLTIVFMLSGKLFGLVIKLVTPLSGMVPIDTIGGVATAAIMAVLAILVFCFIAGLIARSSIGIRFARSIESKLYVIIPRYAFVKSMTASLSGGSDDLQGLVPVHVYFDDYSQIAFEVHRTAEGLVTIYLPGAPDPWSGSIIYVTQDRIEPLDVSFMKVVQVLRKVGIGSERIVTSLRK